MKSHRLVVLVFIFLCLIGASGHGGELGIIELRHRTADEVVRIVTPLLGPDDAISGKGYVVILTGAPDNIARIESIIRNLDRPSRQLLIIVVQGENAREAMASVDVSGNVSIGDDTRIEFGRNPQPENTVSVTGRSDRSAQRSMDVQKVRAREGLAAFIYIGQSIPVSTQAGDPRVHGSRIVFRDVKTGFRVVPRLSGDHFVLDIASQQESTPSARQGAVAAQRIQTQVQGRLNQWLDIGGILGIRRKSDTGFIYSDGRQKKSNSSIFLKIVEVAP